MSQKTSPVLDAPDRNLGMELVRATEAAAIRALPFVGAGDKNAADEAAVDAMRAFLSTVSFDGTIVIGEGEKDEAPMLFNGEHVGNGSGPRCDIAVDPIDGTSLAAAGRPNALSMLAVADSGSLLDASSVFYMEKIATDGDGRGVVDLSQSLRDNVVELARAKGKPVRDLVVAILDRPRHAGTIDEVRSAGARTRLLLDGDVAGAVNAARGGSAVDMCVGVGGSPEGVAAACALRALGGFFQGRLAPVDEAEAERGRRAGLRIGHVYDRDELVSGDNAMFVATGVTDGDLVAGARRDGAVICTESIVLRAASRTVRRVIGEHDAARWGD